MADFVTQSLLTSTDIVVIITVHGQRGKQFNGETG